MKHFQGWASAEEFVAWEEQNFQRDKAAVLRAYQMQRAQRQPAEFPFWTVVAVGSIALGGLSYVAILVLNAVGEWLESLLHNLLP